MNQVQDDVQVECVKAVERGFDRIYKIQDEPLPIALIRAASKMIVCSYPDNFSRTKAVSALMKAAELLKEASA